MNEDDTRTIAEIVGANVKALRTARYLTLSDLSLNLRPYGVNWSTGRLGDIESGRFSPTLQVLLLLSLGLNRPGREDRISPLDLLESAGRVAVTDALILPAETFGRLIDGSLDDLTGIAPAGRGERLLWGADRATKVLDEYTRFPSEKLDDLEEVDRANALFALADARAMRKLGMSRAEFISAAYHQWGQLLSQEVEERAPVAASPQKKGRITRELLDELTELVQRHAGE